MDSVESPSLAGSALAVFSMLEDDPKLRGKGLSAAFARSFPRPPAEASSLAATEAARAAVILSQEDNWT